MPVYTFFSDETFVAPDRKGQEEHKSAFHAGCNGGISWSCLEEELEILWV
jgi:hypothetical protein